jgi:hypothetical protein
MLCPQGYIRLGLIINKLANLTAAAKKHGET